MLALGRLRTDITVERADERVAAVAEVAQELDDHADDENRKLFVYSLYDAWVESVRRPLLLLMGAVGLLALIACANVANLEFARGIGRQHEIALITSLKRCSDC